MALEDTQIIPLATADVAIRQALTVFVRGSLTPHADALAALWRMLLFSRSGARLKFRRSIADVSWQSLSVADREGPFTRILDLASPLNGCRGVELAEQTQDALTGVSVRIVDLAPINGLERASHLRVLLDDAVSVSELVALGEWLIGHLPIWWGSAGYVFDYVAGPSFTAYSTISALAKRYWSIDLQEMLLLEWDALRGIPSVNWLTLLGNDFATSRELNLDDLPTEKQELEALGVFQRRGAYGVALAAGPKPVKGDINVGEDLEPYVAVARRIKPLLLAEQTPLFGPFAKPEVSRAWLGRFGAPRAWLESDISAG